MTTLGKPKAPKPPDPQVTAAAQTGTNISTATANAALGNVNQVTPYGSLMYNQSGQQWIDDANGQSYWKNSAGEIVRDRPMDAGTTTTKKVPIYSTRGGSNGGQYISGYKDETVTSGGDPTAGWNEVKGYYVPTYTATQTLSPEQQAILEQNNIADLNLAKLASSQSGKLGDLLSSPLNLSGAPTAGTAGQYQQFGAAPSLATTFGDAGDITGTIRNAGDIQRSIGDAGEITRTYGTDFSEDRKRVEDALLARQQSLFDRDREANNARLANSGIKLGSQAYAASQDDMNRQLNDARLAAILAGGQEQSRLVGLEANRAGFENAAQAQKYGQLLSSGSFANAAQAQQYGQNANDAQFANSAQAQRYGQLFDRANFSNNALQSNFNNANTVTANNNNIQTQRFNEQNALRSQWLNEQYAQRNQPINEISSLLSGAQVQNPSFVNANMPTIPTVDYAGLVNENFNQKMGIYQQQAAASQGILGGLFGLGSKLIGLSDERAKKDVKPVGKLMGQNIYSFEYRKGMGDGKKHVGVMAQEVARTRPDAVSTRKDGMKQVDYGKLFALGQRMAA